MTDLGPGKSKAPFILEQPRDGQNKTHRYRFRRVKIDIGRYGLYSHSLGIHSKDPNSAIHPQLLPVAPKERNPRPKVQSYLARRDDLIDSYRPHIDPSRCLRMMGSLDINKAIVSIYMNPSAR